MRLAVVLMGVVCVEAGLLEAQGFAPPPPTMPSSALEVSRPDGAWRPAVGEVPLTTALTEPRGTRLSATVDETVYRRDVVVAGTFGVAATFAGLDADSGAVAGLTLGTQSDGPTLVVLLRGDGAVAVRAGAGQSTWRPVVRPTSVGSAVRLRVQVDGTLAHVHANGERITTISVPAGSLDGAPGVFVGAGTEVLVSAFTIESGAPGAPRR